MYKRNCKFCVHLGEDSVGPICERKFPKANLKSFPFENEQACHSPDFWKVLEVDKDMQSDTFGPIAKTEAYKLFVTRYLIPLTKET